MQIRYVTGDLIASEQTLIAHGCNAQGVARSGVFAAIRDRLPFAYTAYRKAFEEPEKSGFRLGAVIWAFQMGDPANPPRIVANMITQEFYGRVPGQRYVSYEALTWALREVNQFVGRTQDGSWQMDEIGMIGEVGFPLVGAGLGGGSWPEIAAIIERESQCFQPVVYTLDGHIPTA